MALAAISGSAQSAPVRPRTIPPLIAYGDSAALAANPSVGALLSSLPPCQPGGLQREPSFAAGLADARALLSFGQSRLGLRRLAAARFTGNPGRAEVTAAGLVTGNAPAAALAALLDAQTRAPRDGTLLVNASALLSALGRPGDALALLDRARQLGGLQGAPLGVPEHAVELNNRGLALLGLGRFSAAAGALGAAARLAGPVLSEAEINLAQALKCQHKPRAAAHAMLAGSYRKRYSLVVTPPIEAPSASGLGLTSPGAPNALAKLTYPATPADAEAANVAFEALDQRDGQQQAKLVAQITTLAGQLNADLQHASPITQRRTANLLRLAAGVGGPTAGPIGLPAPVEAARQAELAYTNQEFGPSAPIAKTCAGVVGTAIQACLHNVCAPALDAAHSNWLARMKALDVAARQAAVARANAAFPAIANLTDPAHQLAEDYVLNFDLTLTSVLTGEAENWDASAADTYGNPTTGLICANVSPTGDDGASGGVLGGPGPCSSSLAAHKLVLNLDVVALKVNCESVEAVIESPGLFGPFVSLEFNFSRNTVTAFIGAKVGGGAVPGELQGGIYVRGGAGGIQDFGLRGSISATTGFIEHGVSTDIVLAGAVATIPSPFAAQ
jgi:tetratricopeptide (TPR) repeat protein